MTSEVLKSLDNVKDLFDRFPNVSVELKTKNKIGVFVTDAFRACKSNSYAKIAALKHLNRQIDRNGVQARIEQAIKHN